MLDFIDEENEGHERDVSIVEKLGCGDRPKRGCVDWNHEEHQHIFDEAIDTIPENLS